MFFNYDVEVVWVVLFVSWEIQASHAHFSFLSFFFAD